MKSIALVALLALGACEGYTSTGQWKEGIPSISGYYVDPVRKCIHVGQVSNGLTRYHSEELINRVASGEKMCPENIGYYEGAQLIVTGYKQPFRNLPVETISSGLGVRTFEITSNRQPNR